MTYSIKKGQTSWGYMERKNWIFDFDGTIADSMTKVFEILNRESPSLGFKVVSDMEIRNLQKMTVFEILKYLELPLYKLPLLLSRVRQGLKNEIQNVLPISGMPEVLKKLKMRNDKLYVLSSNTKQNILRFLSKSNLDIFDGIISGSSLFGKHHYLQKLIKTQHLEKKNCFYIGDEIRDIDGAKKAGIPIISVGWGYNHEDVLLKNDPSYFAKTPEELFEIMMSQCRIL